ncbi:hypothetical protein ACFO6V_22240 [Promicromonospora alba]|uniref:Uncharacterized protein n=1 Tax=Promicromonospora alba TaxID=1616110 RepID=A0ABV9HM22_9MICO
MSAADKIKNAAESAPGKAKEVVAHTALNITAVDITIRDVRLFFS